MNVKYSERVAGYTSFLLDQCKYSIGHFKVVCYGLEMLTSPRRGFGLS